ncbi:hypothetical protein SAMN05880573_12716 [Chryseobacterium sp. RU33C]|nr:hypothetical protein SAMN05880573_12716 [Chryseobacterium sp. RU33C]
MYLNNKKKAILYFEILSFIWIFIFLIFIIIIIFKNLFNSIFFIFSITFIGTVLFLLLYVILFRIKIIYLDITGLGITYLSQSVFLSFFWKGFYEKYEFAYEDILRIYFQNLFVMKYFYFKVVHKQKRKTYSLPIFLFDKNSTFKINQFFSKFENTSCFKL